MDNEEALLAWGLWLPTCFGLPSQMNSYWLMQSRGLLLLINLPG